MSDIKNNVVAAIQGNAVSPNRPTVNGQWYIWNAGTFEFELTPISMSWPLIGGLSTNVLYVSDMQAQSTYINITAPQTIASQVGTGSTTTTISIDATTGVNLTIPLTQISLTSPSGGAASPPPANPSGYLQVMINGTPQYLPFY